MNNYEDWLLSQETIEELDYDRDEYLNKLIKNIEKTQKNY